MRPLLRIYEHGFLSFHRQSLEEGFWLGCLAGFCDITITSLFNGICTVLKRPAEERVTLCICNCFDLVNLMIYLAITSYGRAVSSALSLSDDTFGFAICIQALALLLTTNRKLFHMQKLNAKSMIPHAMIDI